MGNSLQRLAQSLELHIVMLILAASEYIKSLESSVNAGRQAQEQLGMADHEIERMRRENEALRLDNQRLYQEMDHFRQPQRGPPVGHAAQMGYGVQGPDPSRSLPPLINGTATPTTSMQGVQYTDERR